jgi:hypothetical protein
MGFDVLAVTEYLVPWWGTIRASADVDILKEEWTPFAVSRVSSSEVFPSNEQGRETCTANLERALLSMKDPRPGSPLDIPIVWDDEGGWRTSPRDWAASQWPVGNRVHCPPIYDPCCSPHSLDRHFRTDTRVCSSRRCSIVKGIAISLLLQDGDWVVEVFPQSSPKSTTCRVKSCKGLSKIGKNKKKSEKWFIGKCL